MGLMKRILRKIGRLVLGEISSAVIKKHHPTILAVVGDGPTAVCKELIYLAVNQSFAARRNLETPDVEFSLVLSVIGTEEYPTTLSRWIFLTLKTLWQLLILKPYPHFLILEMSPARQQTLLYWLKITHPQLTIICGNPPSFILPRKLETYRLTHSEIGRLKEEIIQIVERFGVDREKAIKAMSGVPFSPTRIRLFSGPDQILVVDATHYYYPVPLAAATELVEDLQGDKAIVTDEKVDGLPARFNLVKPETIIQESRKYSAIIVRGRRHHRFNLLEKLTGGNYE